MTKGEAISLILNKVSGGIYGQDIAKSIRREDVGTYLVAAINYVIIKQYYTDIANEGERGFPDDFIATYQLPVLTDNSRGLKYVKLEAKPFSTIRNRGLRSVSSLRGFKQFIPTTAEELQHNEYYKGSLGDTLYWLEGGKVFFYNLSTMVDEVLVRIVTSISDLDDDDNLPIPAGSEVEMLNITEQFFLGQRQLPKDMINNNNPEK